MGDFQHEATSFFHINCFASTFSACSSASDAATYSSMIITLSPAKSLNFDPMLRNNAFSRPRLEDRSELLVKSLSSMSKAKLKSIMPVSDNLIDLNAGRYADFYAQPEKPALQAFSGDVYIGFEASSLPQEALDFAQTHVRILSGLYGLLRPNDLIRPHRLEMGTIWAPRYKKLTDFWGTRIVELLAHDASESDAPFLLNLASNEYWAAVKPHSKKLTIPIVHVDFRQMTESGPKFQSFAAKRARGMMARYICEHRIETIEGVQAFDSDGYAFLGQEGDTLRFVRS